MRRMRNCGTEASPSRFGLYSAIGLSVHDSLTIALGAHWLLDQEDFAPCATWVTAIVVDGHVCIALNGKRIDNCLRAKTETGASNNHLIAREIKDTGHV